MRVISWDTETFLIAPGVAAPRLVCVSYSDGAGTEDVVTHDAGLNLFLRWIDDPSVVLVAHHAPFDLVVMAAEAEERGLGLQVLRSIFRAIKEGRVRCSRIREKILENAKGELKYDWDEEEEVWRTASFTLERCVWNRLKVFVKKTADTWRKRYGLLYRIPVSQWPPEAVEYALKDSILCRELFFAQETAALEEDCPLSIETGLAEIPGETATTLTAFCFGLMRTWGVRTDPEMTAVVEKEFQAKFDAAATLAKKWKLVGEKKVTEIRSEFTDRYDGSKESLKAAPPEAKHRVTRPKRNMKAIRDRIRFIYTSRGQDVPMTEPSKMYPGGQISTDREALTLKRFPTWEKDEGLSAVADVVRYEKLLKTYVPILKRGAKYPITPDWNEMVETFRTSCARPNLQNLPRGSTEHGDDMVRRCFIPRPGWVFVACDYSTLEMRTLAQRMIDLGYSHALAEAFIQGKDPHVIMTSEMLGLSYEVTDQRYKAGDKLVEDARQGNKITNYGCGGGMGADALRDYARGYEKDISIELARKLHGNFRRTWQTDDYFNYCSAHVGEHGECETYEDPRTGYVRGKIRYTALCNWGFQHPAAVGAKAALCRVVEECYVVESSPLFGCRVVIFPHDEIILEVPREWIGAARASAAADRLEEVMVEEMEVICPDVPIEAGAVMIRRWIKGARAVRIDGALVPSRKEGKNWVHDDGQPVRKEAAA